MNEKPDIIFCIVVGIIGAIFFGCFLLPLLIMMAKDMWQAALM